MDKIQQLINAIQSSSIEKSNQDDTVIDNFNLHRRQLDKLSGLKELSEKLTKTIQDKTDEVMQDKTDYLLTLDQPEQLSDAWFAIRKKMLTASDIGSILGLNKYSSANAIIKKKLGVGAVFKGNAMTFHGQRYEDIACKAWENRYSKTVREYGLIQHRELEILGASPDGISTDGIMLEIKVPSQRKINGIIPTYYYSQMQAQLQVCDLDRCDFFECNIDEYRNEEDYDDDMFIIEDISYLDILPIEISVDFIKLPEDRRTAYGLEKGIIGVYQDAGDETNKHLYPPFTMTSQEQTEWLDNHQIKNEKVYWKITMSSNSIVPRSHKWWDEEHKVEETLRSCWAKIEKARLEGIESVMKIRKTKPKVQKEKVEKVYAPAVSGFGFLSDNEEKPKKKSKKVKKVKKVKKELEEEETTPMTGFGFLSDNEEKPKKKSKKVIKKVKKVIKKVKKVKKVIPADESDTDSINLGGCGFLD